MLKIRLQRTGRKAQPTYRLVLADSKSSAKSGKYLELLGNYDSRRGEKSEIKAERVKELISLGAQLSPTIHNLLLDKKIISGKKINKLPLKKAIKKESAEAPAEAVKETAPAVETAAETAPETTAPAEESTPTEEPAEAVA